MAKKRLNKKAAIVGSIFIMFIILMVIGAILYLSRDPQKYLEDGEAALAAGDYKTGTHNLLKARSLSKDDDFKVMVLFKLADAYIEMGQWNNTMGCWGGVIQLEPKNIKARLNRLTYLYMVASSGSNTLWKEIEEQSSEFLEKIVGSEAYDEEISKWLISSLKDKGSYKGSLGSYLYFLRGRAVLENVERGAVTDAEASLTVAVEDLETVRQDQPENVDAYWRLAQAIYAKAKIFASRGDVGALDDSYDSIEKLLQELVENAPENPESHVNLIRSQMVFGHIKTNEQLLALEDKYVALKEKFPDSALVFASLAEYYQRLGFDKIDVAIEASEKSKELEPENVVYALNTARINYKKYKYTNEETYFSKAIVEAETALKLPNAQETEGPRKWANKMNRASVCAFLGSCYTDKILNPELVDDQEKDSCLKKMEAVVYDIEQIYGSGEEPQVIKWKGLLELSKGNRDVAVRKLYGLYEQFKASERRDVELSYRLAKVFDTTDELGAASEFYRSALKSPGGIGREVPEAFLDYGELLLKLRAYNESLSAYNAYSMMGGISNDRSLALYIRALIFSNQFESAREELNKAEVSDVMRLRLESLFTFSKIRETKQGLVYQQFSDEEENADKQINTEHLNKELKSYTDSLAQVVDEMFKVSPNDVSAGYVMVLCDGYLELGEIDKSKSFSDRYIELNPNDSGMLFYRQSLDEPDPKNISLERRAEIELGIINAMSDPVKQAMNMGVYYQKQEDLDSAIGAFKQIVDIDHWDNSIEELTAEQKTAISYLFEIGLSKEDYTLAEQTASLARQYNIDSCGGQYFEARILMAKKDYKGALLKLDSCIKQRPVFSYAYMLRSKVNSALGNEHSSLQDIRKAASFNLLNGDIAKDVAVAVYLRNQKLGDSVSSDQKLEARTALERAMVLNPVDMKLRSIYAEYISDDEPGRALSIRQRLQKANPSVENGLLLSRLASDLGFKSKNKEQQAALFEIADASYRETMKLAPMDKSVVYHYAEYLNKRGKKAEAEAVIKAVDDPKLMWNHYYQSGDIDKAKAILDKLYADDPKDINVLKGQLLVAENRLDREQIRKYSEELLALEESAENRLFRIRSFLKAGLIKESATELEIFKQKYPDNEKLLVLETWLKMSQGHLAEALELAKVCVDRDQDDFTGWRLKGEINLMLGNYDQAVNDLKQSKVLNNEPGVRISLAKAYLRVGKENDAITELENTADDPTSPTGAKNMLEQIYMRLGKKDLLRKFYVNIIKTNPESVYWYLRAAAFAMEQENLANAEILYQKAWELSNKYNKGQSIALDGYLKVLVDRKQYDRVLKLGRDYIDSKYAPIAYFRMAEAKLAAGDKKTAIEYCKKAVEKAEVDENYASEMLKKAYSLIGADEVINICQQKLDSDPKSLYANFAMYNICMLNDQFNKSIEYINNCINIVGPDDPNRVKYIAQKVTVLELANKKTSDKSYLEKAIKEYESLLEEMPNNVSILNNLSYMLAQQGEKLEKALEYSGKAYKMMPDNANIMDTYSYVLFKNGKYEKAAEYLQAALQQYEKDSISAPSDVYNHLGMIKESLGLSSEALAAYKQALEVGEQSLTEQEKSEIRKKIEMLTK